MQPSKAWNAMKIFVVEDAPEVRKRLVAMLQRVAGLTVVGEADSVRAAIDGVLASGADVLLLDLQLADGSGLEVLAGVQSERPDLRVIVLTNLLQEPFRTQCLALGAQAVLDKSREFARVPEMLRGWLNVDADQQPPVAN
jgi:DNA-binding NarL/FixJ family response regulator